MKHQYDVQYRLVCGNFKSPKFWPERVDLAKGSRLGTWAFNHLFARPRRRKDSIVGFLAHDLQQLAMQTGQDVKIKLT